MQIIVVGAGKVGFNLSNVLSEEGHDVIVIEKNAERLDLINNKLDVQVIEGNGASPKIQRLANIKQADLLIAVTDVDEVNILACQLAKKNGVPTTVARLRDISYANDDEFLESDSLGVDLFLNPEQVTAEVIRNLILMPEADSINYFESRKIVMVELTVSSTHPYLGSKLKDLSSDYPFLITAIKRGDSFIIPSGDDELIAGDSIFIVMRTEHLPAVEAAIGFRRTPVHQVMILGGGLLGYHLATILEPTDINVKMVERDLARCERLADLLDSTIILHGDATDIDLLREEGIQDVDILVSATEDDKLNVLVCLLCSRLGAKRTVAQIRRSDYLPLIESVGIDVAVSPRVLLDEAILRFTRKGNIESIARIATGAAEVLEFEVTGEKKRLLNRALKDLKFPKGVIISAIYRDDEVIIPRGNDRLLLGDRVVLFVIKEKLKHAEKLIN